jgi:hypothetical protein
LTAGERAQDNRCVELSQICALTGTAFIVAGKDLATQADLPQNRPRCVIECLDGCRGGVQAVGAQLKPAVDGADNVSLAANYAAVVAVLEAAVDGAEVVHG